MTWITAQRFESSEGWKASVWSGELSNLELSIRHPLGCEDRPFPCKTPSLRSPGRKNVGCSVDGAISTEFMLNNPLAQDGKGSEWVGRNTFSVRQGWNLECWYILKKKTVQVFVCSCSSTRNKRQPGWNLGNRWNPGHQWPLSHLVQFKPAAKHQHIQSELPVNRWNVKKYSVLLQKSLVTCQVGQPFVLSMFTVSTLAVGSLIPQHSFHYRSVVRYGCSVCGAHGHCMKKNLIKIDYFLK